MPGASEMEDLICQIARRKGIRLTDANVDCLFLVYGFVIEKVVEMLEDMEKSTGAPNKGSIKKIYDAFIQIHLKLCSLERDTIDDVKYRAIGKISPSLEQVIAHLGAILMQYNTIQAESDPQEQIETFQLNYNASILFKQSISACYRLVVKDIKPRTKIWIKVEIEGCQDLESAG